MLQWVMSKIQNNHRNAILVNGYSDAKDVPIHMHYATRVQETQKIYTCMRPYMSNDCYKKCHMIVIRTHIAWTFWYFSNFCFTTREHQGANWNQQLLQFKTKFRRKIWKNKRTFVCMCVHFHVYVHKCTNICVCVLQASVQGYLLGH